MFDSFENAVFSQDDLFELGADVLRIDIQNEQEFENMRVQYDAIIHLAAQVSVPKSIQFPKKNHSVNVIGARNVLRLAQQNNVSRFIFASSSAVYGDCECMPLTRMRMVNYNPHAQSKSEMEEKLMAISARVRISEPSLFNVYGPNQRLDSDYGAVIPIFINLLSRGIQPSIFGSGNQSRDFVHVHDVARLLVDLSIEQWPQPKQSVYNVGTGIL